MADQMAYTGAGAAENPPSIDEVKALQAKLGRRDEHIVWLGELSFVIAHTDEERATINLETCPVHEMLLAADQPPVEWTGYYLWLPEVGRFEPLELPTSARQQAKQDVARMWRDAFGTEP